VTKYNDSEIVRRIEDSEGTLWPLIQSLKRLDDRLRIYGLGVQLVTDDKRQPIELRWDIVLTDESDVT
jgi:hypothetical protein